MTKKKLIPAEQQLMMRVPEDKQLLHYWRKQSPGLCKARIIWSSTKIQKQYKSPTILASQKSIYGSHPMCILSNPRLDDVPCIDVSALILDFASQVKLSALIFSYHLLGEKTKKERNRNS